MHKILKHTCIITKPFHQQMRACSSMSMQSFAVELLCGDASGGASAERVKDDIALIAGCLDDAR